jgi:hypothetical protein
MNALQNEMLNCDNDDLLALYAICIRTFFRGNFEQFKKETELEYIEYAKSRIQPYTYSQYVNRQILALT